MREKAPKCVTQGAAEVFVHAGVAPRCCFLLLVTDRIVINLDLRSDAVSSILAVKLIKRI